MPVQSLADAQLGDSSGIKPADAAVKKGATALLG